MREAVQIRHGYIFGRAVLTASLAQLGHSAEALGELDEIRCFDPGFSAVNFTHYPMREAARAHLFDGLGKAGLDI